MTRLKVDQACLAAQVQQQIAQRLNAELAVPCPDCGAEAGRACQGDFGRSVVTHLARSVASMRRDTEPCPPHSAEADRAAATCFCCLQSPGADGVIEHRPLCYYKTPTASDCAPSPAASAPDADETVLPRAGGDSGRPVSVCQCGQTIWNTFAAICGDCRSMLSKPFHSEIDDRIAAAQPEREPDRVHCAWSSPDSEGESW